MEKQNRQHEHAGQTGYAAAHDTLDRRLALVMQPTHRTLLGEGLSGIERETLRVESDGALALTPHPRALGSALTNDEITTDYSEALLEFITPPQHDAAQVIARLHEIHQFAYRKLGAQLLWSDSMPPALPPEDVIPIADYGTSHIGMLKHVYRRGLALRYGKPMQCIAGIHYNFSLAEPVWELLRESEGAKESARDYQSARYVALIRNFRRYSWLLMYLFGASPVLHAEFLRGRQHGLESFDEGTLGLPYATSLRMSDLGYQNSAQSEVSPCYDCLPSYIDALTQAVSQPHPAYEALGTKRNGEWIQLSTNLLQIENEFYATIRPKRVTYSGERPVQALARRGVQYVEVRCIDIDPFLPVGIDVDTARFIDAFLLFCALEDSPSCSNAENMENRDNFAHVVKQGRKPGLMLHRGGEAITLLDWAEQLLERIDRTAAAFDAQRGGAHYAHSMALQRAKVRDVSLTPSARVMAALEPLRGTKGGAFQAFALAQSQRHAQTLRDMPLDAAVVEHFETLARKSLEAQAELERTQVGDFDAFVAAYRAGTLGTVTV
ncbi:glutamate--cysteine ligase [Pandoraea nosoerga]|uniref:glutamate--cysteine ligase n=1 Tax=Pandoraea nosoerga TaxID=2508296 RepID=UPI00123FD27B|nr:glutamate--cysteine ligase [Pandoraea nosoerga]MBN4665783.1 glutamate--cysteine ligase [Pandoraea nosoerga]MBN4677237.1 glutamate--cysteine ligase [Pandoraea nosoerga]MBN4681098.1 glutamate--cysteine ligase [Pandoraea nosoerga]MBN4746409.1 glutamate--cysteine ligase [Pandoraea nosoerga]